MKKLLAFFKIIFSFIRHDIWITTDDELSKAQRFSYRMVKTIVIAIRGFVQEELNIRASALTYSILFAIIPLFALVIAIAKGFGVEKLIEDSLEGTYIAQVNMVPTVMGFVERYLELTQGGLFIGIGILILFMSVMNFFKQVENAFNDIWQVRKSRSALHQFTIYFSAILIVPVLIVLSSGFSIFVSTAVSHSFLYDVLSPFLRFGVKFIPYVINWIVFTVMYTVIPNTRVRFFNALVAGIIAGSAFQAFQMLYINGQVYLSRYNMVYGSFAAIPLLFLWLQISCLIVLLGAEISYASQNIQNFDYDMDTRNISNRYKNFLTLFITYVIVKQFENQEPSLSSDQISDNYKIPIRLVNQILTSLVDVEILVEVSSENSRSKTYLPSFDIHKLTVGMLFTKLDKKGSESFLFNKNELLDSFWHKTEDLKHRAEEYSEEILVIDLL